MRPAFAAAVIVLSMSVANAQDSPDAFRDEAVQPRQTIAVGALPLLQPQNPVRTAVIRGLVIEADTGRPLAGALIELGRLGVEIDGQRTTRSDANGRYEFADLVKGTYRLSASNAGFVTVGHGKRRTTRLTRLLEISDGAALEQVDFVLARAGALEGHLIDERGAPVTGATVRIMRRVYLNGQPRLVVVGDAGGEMIASLDRRGGGEIGASTDGRGYFRLDHIPPGDYLIAAQVPHPSLIAEGNALMSGSFAPVYYPGAASAADAQVVTIAAGQEVSDIVFPMVPAGASTISGTVRSADGRPVLRAMATLVEDAWFTNVTVRQDGSFEFANVAPGRYRVIVSSNGAEVASARVTLAGTDVMLELTPSKGSTARGRIRFDTGAPGPDSVPAQFEIVLQSGDSATATRLPTPSDYSRADGTFALPGILGSYLLRVNGSATYDWHLKSVLHHGVDVTDTPIEFNGADVDGLDIVLTQKVTGVTGTVTGVDGRPDPDSTVVMFADDSRRWGMRTRFVAMEWPNQAGRFTFRGLPPGRYVIAAVVDTGQGDHSDPVVLEKLRRTGTLVTLEEGASRTVDLTSSER